MRFEERLELDVFIDEKLSKFRVPTLNTQLLVEKAIKHEINLIVKIGIINITIKK
ncbi:hypothetical protein Q4553_06030 [Tenacibaculum soleae]|uniref:hypothetical protein n=1 Tax=Tenacibaculum soleae TaxID=447689 RepID=UPI0026E1EBDD|nr:hypothetical protein [Tenacibaculum soleae]MDO6744125.1 hypothetical protein [Tenacibaculum soleae]